MTLDGGYTAFPSYSDALSTLYSQSSPGHAHMPILLWVIKEDTCNIIRIAIQIYLSIAFHRCCALLRICNANGFRVHNSRLIESGSQTRGRLLIATRLFPRHGLP